MRIDFEVDDAVPTKQIHRVADYIVKNYYCSEYGKTTAAGLEMQKTIGEEIDRRGEQTRQIIQRYLDVHWQEIVETATRKELERLAKALVRATQQLAMLDGSNKHDD
jgi:hypothetical protein